MIKVVLFYSGKCAITLNEIKMSNGDATDMIIANICENIYIFIYTFLLNPKLPALNAGSRGICS